MFQFCFFISIALDYCIDTKNLLPVGADYNTVIERSADMIISHEAPNGPELQAYKDVRGYSIGYGTRSYEGEVITKQEAYARFKSILHESVEKVMIQFPYATEDQIVALTSIYFNCWRGWKKIKQHGPEAMLEPGFCQLSGYSGLLKRRAEERYLFGFDAE